MNIERFENYAFVAHSGAHLVSFVVSEVIDDGGDAFYGSGTSEFVSEFDEAERFLTGSIKWDGCSNWMFGDPKHFCGRKAAVSVGTLLDHLYEIASQRVDAYEAQDGE